MKRSWTNLCPSTATVYRVTRALLFSTVIFCFWMICFCSIISKFDFVSGLNFLLFETLNSPLPLLRGKHLHRSHTLQTFVRNISPTNEHPLLHVPSFSSKKINILQRITPRHPASKRKGEVRFGRFSALIIAYRVLFFPFNLPNHHRDPSRSTEHR